MSHHSLYNVNGLMFWSEEEIRVRNMIVEHMVSAVSRCLLSMNQAFKMIQCEAPLLTPAELISSSYTADDCFFFEEDKLTTKDIRSDKLPTTKVLRPETTMGSYAYARHILSGYHDPKYKLPICVWQHGKSFRKEQDQPTKFMRLKEFYQLEFQILFAASTANDYYPAIVEATKKALTELLNSGYTEKSDRLPDYSDETTDVIFIDNMYHPQNLLELCSISRRKDFDPNIKNIEVAIGTDRCVAKFLNKRGLIMKD